MIKNRFESLNCRKFNHRQFLIHWLWWRWKFGNRIWHVLFMWWYVEPYEFGCRMTFIDTNVSFKATASYWCCIHSSANHVGRRKYDENMYVPVLIFYRFIILFWVTNDARLYDIHVAPTPGKITLIHFLVNQCSARIEGLRINRSYFPYTNLGVLLVQNPRKIANLSLYEDVTITH